MYILETNTQPVTTPTSCVPVIAKYHGFDFYNLINRIVEDAAINR